jgi:hypothetical protein
LCRLFIRQWNWYWYHMEEHQFSEVRISDQTSHHFIFTVHSLLIDHTFPESFNSYFLKKFKELYDKSIHNTMFFMIYWIFVSSTNATIYHNCSNELCLYWVHSLWKNDRNRLNNLQKRTLEKQLYNSTPLKNKW